MNILGLVFSILLILSYGYYALWDKHVAGIKLRNTYTSHQQANREIVNQYESAFYNGLRGAKSAPSSEKPGKKKTEKEPKTENETEKTVEFNKECARLNLWPLIQEGREDHLLLYELAAKLIRTFYGPLNTGEKRFEYEFLNVLLVSAKKAVQEKEFFSLEKISLLDPKFQKVYYKMLKGTKKWDLREEVGYPPLLDYVKAEPLEGKICLFHAHPDMITVIFNSKFAKKFYDEIHKKDGSPLTEELIKRLASENRIISLDPDLFKLLQLNGYFGHEEKKTTFVADEGGVLLRKKLSL